MSYVKNHDVGSIRLDAPRTDFIYELPLLSFGDVQHTIELSLVFNSRFATSNPFYMANGYKLNMQKRLIMSSNGYPQSYENEHGALVTLNKQGGRYSFEDDTQRFIGLAGIDYKLDNPDYSYEMYDNLGKIKSATDKYGVTYLRYGYDAAGKLISITFRENKVIEIGYSTTLGLVDSISYKYNGETVCTSAFTYPVSNNVKVAHYTGVDYHMSHYNGTYIAYSADSGSAYSNVYSHRLTCTSSATGLTVQKEIGNKTVNTVGYDFLKLSSDNKIAIMDATDFHGVKTRMQFDGENLVYSYEFAESMFTPDETTPNYTYLGKVNYHIKNQISGVQSYTDGIKMTYMVDEYGTRYDRFKDSQNVEGAVMLSGWLKSIDNVSECNITFYNGESHEGSLPVSILAEDSWTYFCVGVPNVDFNNMSVSIGISKERVLMADFRLIYNENDNHTTTEETVFIFNSAQIHPINKETEFYFCTEAEAEAAIESGDYSSLNKLNLSNHYITANDIVRYQINEIKGNYTNEAYVDNCRQILYHAKPLMVKLGNSIWDVTAVSVGKRYQRGDRTYLTRNNVSSGDILLTTVSYIDGTEISRQEYNTSFDIIHSTTDGLGTIFQYATDEYGRSTGLVTRKIVGAISTTATYDLDAFKLLSTTDENDVTTTYTTDSIWGVVTKSTVSDGTSVTDTYDTDMCALEKKTFAKGADSKEHSFSYSGGNLTGLVGGTLNYGFEYTNGSLSKVLKLNSDIEQHALSNSDKTLSSFYPSQSRALYSVVSHTDNYGRLTEVEGVVENTYDVNPTYESSQFKTTGVDNGAGKLATSTDKTNNNVTKYAYNKDKLQRVEVFNSSGTSLNNETFEYDSLGRMTKNTYTFGTKTVGNSFTYLLDTTAHNADQRIGSASYLVNGVSKATATNYFDTYKRIRRKLISIGNTYDREITYDATRIARILDVKNGSTINNVSYAYDLHGRITSESDSVNTNVNTTYVYDSFGQLVRENNKALDKTFIYSYNEIGNITAVTEYSYSTAASPSTYLSRRAYSYSSSPPDRLLVYLGKIVSHDTLGYPTSHGDQRFVWTKGRLTRLYQGSATQSGSLYDDCSFTYDAYGRRTKKVYAYDPDPGTYDSGKYTETTDYTYDNSGRLIREFSSKTDYSNTTTTRELIFLYDESGIIGVMYSYNGATAAPYFYRRNLQGDVTAIYDREGNRVGEYAYDAWGNCTILSGASNDLVSNNPIRYRGYYLDSETGLYYLNARYYSPQWRRFISPDSTEYLDPESVNGLNLYAYCGNDPVNYADSSGNSAFLIAMSILAFAGLITTGVGMATDNNLVTAIGLTAIAMPAMISGGFALSLLTPVGICVGATTLVASAGTVLFASAEYQETFTGNNWMLSELGEGWYNGLMITTATIATLGTAASSIAYSFNINTVTEFGKLNGSDFKGIKFTQKRNGGIVHRSLEFHHGHAHGGHKLHWQLNKWSKTGIKSRGGTAWWTIWLKRIP